MEAKYQETILGENICKKIKYIYFHGYRWEDCNKQVAFKFSMLKKSLRYFYSIDSTENNIELLKKVMTFTNEDIKQAIDSFEEKIESDKINDAKYGDNVTWVPIPLDRPDLLDQVKKILDQA